jgi:hypothetical protein
VGVVLAQHVADHPGRLLVGLVVGVAQVPHPEKDALVDGFEAVPHVGQRPAHYHGHGVVQVRFLHLLDDGPGLYLAVVEVLHLVAGGGLPVSLLLFSHAFHPLRSPGS